MFNVRLTSLRKKKNKTQQELADYLGLTRPAYTAYERGNRSPDYDTLQKIADYFGVTTDYLLGRTEIRNPTSNSLKPVKNFFRIPILGYIAAGEPILAVDHIKDYVDIPFPGDYDPDELFMLKVKGDSMTGSRIYDGDTVLVKIQPEVENGEIAVVNVNGDEATLKKVKRLENGQYLLISSNDAYDPILVNHEGARIIGKVIQVIFEP